MENLFMIAKKQAEHYCLTASNLAKNTRWVWMKLQEKILQKY